MLGVSYLVSDPSASSLSTRLKFAIAVFCQSGVVARSAAGLPARNLQLLLSTALAGIISLELSCAELS